MSLIIESLEVKDEYFELSSQLVAALQKDSLLDKEKLVVGICGESGSGKSVTAKCLQIELEKRKIPTIILHQDSYYQLPPRQNHEKRKSDISWVGPGELRLELFQAHLEQFKANEESITVPVVDYENNVFSERQVAIGNKSVLIVEGVYSFVLNQLDYKIFIERTYKDTLATRRERTREVYDPFVEQVLNIEHSIVKPLGESADLVVGKDYSVTQKKGK